jgi:uncharacterized protein YbjT (DUF2867 family)
VPVDYNDVAALTTALKGTDAIVSTLGFSALQLQIPIAQAAQAAGVRLFVPSEFGMATDKATSGVLAMKRKLAGDIRAVGVPTTIFFTGVFSDWVWQPYVVAFFGRGCRVS